MKIAQVAARALPYTGGTETHVDEVSSRLAEIGHEVVVLTTDPKSSMPAEEKHRGFLVRRFHAWPKNRDWYVSPGLFMAIVRGGFDIVHVQGVHTAVAPLAMVAARISRTPFVLTFHTGGHSSGLRHGARSAQWRILAPLLKSASLLICVSRHEAELFNKVLRLPDDRYVVIRNGADMPEPAGESPDLPEGSSPVISSVGRLERYKGHHRLIEAMPAILEKTPHALAVIVGNGPYERSLQDQVRQLGLEHHVCFRHFPSNERSRLADLVKSSDVVVLLSEYEAHPISVTETLALKRPVVVANTSGLTELVNDGLVKGVEIDASPDEIAKAILGAIGTTPGEIEIPTWKDCVTKLQDAYQTAIKAEPGKYMATD